MNKSRKINALLILLAAIAAVGYISCVVSVAVTIIKEEMLSKPFCFKSECVKCWASSMEYSLLIGKSTSDLLVAIATVGGIVVALWSYFSNVNNSAFSNYIAHYLTFQSYLNSEIAKRTRISSTSIDTFELYNYIFPRAKAGEIYASQEYRKFVDDLNSKIKISNDLVATPNSDLYRYKNHQNEIKIHCKVIGIEISLQPRMEFYEIEDQLMSLITSINRAFCSDANLSPLTVRKYV